MVGPDYAVPPAPVPHEYKELDGWKIAEPRDDIDRGDWWAVYNDLELDGLLQEVDVNNQNIVLAEAAFHQSVAMVTQARSSLFPALAVGYIPTRWHEGKKAAAAFGEPATSAVTQTTVTLSPQVSWTLDVWGQIRRQVESDISAAQASAANFANVKLLARTQLATAYFNLRAADSLQWLLDETVATYREIYEIADAKYKRGTVSIYDVITAKTQMQTALAQRWVSPPNVQSSSMRLRF